ncbi:MAG: 2Fe-2S iron-sulfur cluster-binding protein [Proteobacteria bacterium]|nr:2Fe-2S iron-sulfur cluster-binding protein [Pseudomonadota bacterium]
MSTTSAPLVDGRFARRFVLACGLVPGLLLVVDALRHQLGVNDVNFAIRTTGLLGLVFLSLSLLVTPLRRLSGWSVLIAARRNLGLFGFAYLTAHFVIFWWWDREGSIADTLAEIVLRPYLWFGAAALVLMIPLAITSTDAMVARLGKRWKQLHRLAYVVVGCGLVHYYLLVKSDVTKPVAFAIAFGVLMVARLVPARRAPARVTPAPSRTFWRGELRLARIVDETPDVKTFRFVARDGGPIPFDHVAGQYLTLALAIDGKRVNRSYTIASPPTRTDHVEISVKRAPNGNGGSRHVHATFAVGELVRIAAPAGKFVFAGHEAERVVLIAGGVGITPMMSILRGLTDRGWGGHAYLAYTVRTAADVIFGDELADLVARHPNVHLLISLSSERGHLTAAMLTELVPDFTRGPVMMCGPTPMMVATRRLLVDELHLPDADVHEEEFVSTPIGDAPAIDGDAAADPSAVFDVQFTRGGRRTEVAGLTVLEAAEACGVAIPFECRSGICGQCKTRLVAGQVSMEVADALTPAERARGLVLACQARPTTDVVIDA